jgi:ribose/xylose/arabinose/galactoside ABC-type transport system permease subunit
MWWHAQPFRRRARMSYLGPEYTHDDQPRFVGEGFRVEPDFRQETGEPEYMPESADNTTRTSDTLKTGAPTAAELGAAFDDPAHGEPGRDRLGIHAIWETFLLLALAGVALATYARHGHPLDLVHVRSLMITATILGLLALGAGLSLRAGAVNLALGPTLVVSGLFFAKYLHHGFWPAAGVAVGIAAGIGLILAIVVVGLSAPGWAASLGAFVGILVWLGHLPLSIPLTTRYDLPKQAYYIFGGFAVLAVGGGALGAIRSIRRAIGRYRPVSDPADQRGTPALVMTGLAILGSSVMAGIGGIILAMQGGGAASADSLQLSVGAVAVALFAGTSVYGRRGGIFGTVLAVSLFTLVSYYTEVADWQVDPYVLIGGALLFGLVASRLVETFGRPDRDRETAEESTSRWLERTEGWADQMPTRTYELPRGPEVPRTPSPAWSDTDPWGTR